MNASHITSITAFAGLLVVLVRNGWLRAELSFRTKWLQLHWQIGKANGRR